MARKASRKSAARPTSRGSKSERERIIEAFMALLAEKPIERIDFAEIAKSAHASLSDLRGIFASTLAILAAQMREIDRAVLAGGDAELADEPPRERLFDVLMRRLEGLAPHKAAVRSLMRSASRNPGLALALNSLSARSQQWMLTAANLPPSGPRGMVRPSAWLAASSSRKNGLNTSSRRCGAMPGPSSSTVTVSHRWSRWPVIEIDGACRAALATRLPRQRLNAAGRTVTIG